MGSAHCYAHSGQVQFYSNLLQPLHHIRYGAVVLLWFRAHPIHMTIDITFCGDWAGNSYPSSCPGTCPQRLMDPANFVVSSTISYPIVHLPTTLMPRKECYVDHQLPEDIQQTMVDCACNSWKHSKSSGDRCHFHDNCITIGCFCCAVVALDVNSGRCRGEQIMYDVDIQSTMVTTTESKPAP